jgi:hypothetical protein
VVWNLNDLIIISLPADEPHTEAQAPPDSTFFDETVAFNERSLFSSTRIFDKNTIEKK